MDFPPPSKIYLDITFYESTLIKEGLEVLLNHRYRDHPQLDPEHKGYITDRIRNIKFSRRRLNRQEAKAYIETIDQFANGNTVIDPNYPDREKKFEAGKTTLKEIDKYLRQGYTVLKIQRLGGGKDTKYSVQPAS